MIPHKPNFRRPTLFVLSIFVFSTLKIAAQAGDAAAGKSVFTSQCASCHSLTAKVVGPPLEGVESKWDDPAMLRKWIHNYQEVLNAGYPRAKEIINYAPTNMQIFGSSLKDADVENVLAYIRDYKPPVVVKDPNGEPEGDGKGAIIFGIISIILAIIALILMQVNSNLKKLSDDKEGIHRPEPVAFYKNKFYIALGAILFFVIGGYFIAKGAIGLGRPKRYAACTTHLLFT
jgi:mono/diheme cytochrome c family protein